MNTTVDTSTAQALERLIHHYQSLRVDNVDQLAACYAADASFRDPFNDVRGRESIKRVFSHMFEQVTDPGFTVLERFAAESGFMLRWRFDFRLQENGALQSIEGMSLIRFDAYGLVREHVDYWDAAGELYAKLPLLGALMRWLRKRLAAK